MQSKVMSGVLVVTLLAAGGCGSDDTTDSAAPGASSAAQGRGPGGPGGGGMGNMQTFTAVNLNTDGDSPGGANTAEVVTAAKAFLATLDATTLDKVSFDFTDNQSRQTWSNYPATTVARKGVALKDLTEAQRTAALAMLKVALSDDGYQQVLNIQKSDDYLNSLGGQGADGFGSLVDYFVAVYGTPSATDPFMIQFGGHHLARNLTYNGTKVSQTPQFVGSEPTSFQVDGKTVAPVEPESDSMFAMVAALSADQKTAAKLTSGTYDDLLMGPTHDDGTFPASEGLAVSGLSAAQKKLVTAAMTAYVADLPADAAAKSLAKYQSELDSTKIAWANNTGPSDESSYIRIDGPSVWIEFINTRSMSTPNIHYHSVYRDKTNDYGSTKPS
ncbi:DUF3500 domain-containing protein [Actinoplanes sp. L3-i22]|uniref:DUF3500 domain-containing protein n=1 Tax=Actinoplanes sp. L3-i22 TaxID=2836373 RepID=UPI001C74AEB5|nr:DUF3500 domain-containing protein [Actinoplanes sp. L3-i22]BCY09864.1 hypothetical protein L3i22_049520 [Actinoplanes sp. L3-i22]